MIIGFSVARQKQISHSYTIRYNFRHFIPDIMPRVGTYIIYKVTDRRFTILFYKIVMPLINFLLTPNFPSPLYEIDILFLLFFFFVVCFSTAK